MRLTGVSWCGQPYYWLLAQEREHREHAAVVLGGGRQPELHEDARHVLLDGAHGHEHPLGDRLVRTAFRHQLEHLALARRQLGERIVAAAATHEPRDDLRVE